jgi:hypothetical protein
MMALEELKMAINFWAVAVGAVAGFLLGGLWYSHKVFGLIWNREAGRGREAQQPHPPRVFAVSLVFALATAVTFAVCLGPEPALTAALQQGLLVGIGFVAASLGITYQFANLSMTMSLIDGGYHVARFLLYAVILGLWH